MIHEVRKVDCAAAVGDVLGVSAVFGRSSASSSFGVIVPGRGPPEMTFRVVVWELQASVTVCDTGAPDVTSTRTVAVAMSLLRNPNQLSSMYGRFANSKEPQAFVSKGVLPRYRDSAEFQTLQPQRPRAPSPLSPDSTVFLTSSSVGHCSPPRGRVYDGFLQRKRAQMSPYTEIPEEAIFVYAIFCIPAGRLSAVNG